MLDEHRPRAAHHQRKRNRGDRKGATHHEYERRIPLTEHVQETDDARRVDHLGNAEAKAEREPATERGDDGLHGSTCLMMNTVIAATTMNVSVAVKDRFERLAIPQTP